MISPKHPSSLNWPRKIETDLTTVLSFSAFRSILLDAYETWTEKPQSTAQKIERAMILSRKKSGTDLEKTPFFDSVPFDEPLDPSIASSQRKILIITSSGRFFQPRPQKTTTKTSVKKIVSFHSLKKVVLIPTCAEYYEERLTNNLWWTEKELEQFKEYAISEIRAFMKIIISGVKTL